MTGRACKNCEWWYDAGNTIVGECRYILSENCMGSIAKISKLDGENDSPPEDEAIANAHLIAAAPDLYEALEKVEKVLVPLYDIYADDSAREILRGIRTALSRARGEEKGVSE